MLRYSEVEDRVVLPKTYLKGVQNILCSQKDYNLIVCQFFQNIGEETKQSYSTKVG